MLRIYGFYLNKKRKTLSGILDILEGIDLSSKRKSNSIVNKCKII